VLEGSVRRDGNRVLITAQLVDAQTDTHLWSETFERELNDIFAIQREIAQAIVAELQVELGREAPVLADRTPTTSPVAHDLYLRGRFEMNQRGEHMPQAIRYFEEAIAEDPDYAKAYGGLALAGSLAGAYGFGEPGLVERSLAAADRAIALDPTLSEPHTARGNSPTRIGGVRAAEQELNLAVQLDPNDANAHQFLGRALMALGMQEEALASATRAILLDPSNVAHHWTRGMFHSFMGDFVEAESDYREALRLEPGNRFALQLLQVTLAASGQFDSLRAVTPPDDGIGEMLLRLADPEQRDEGLASLRSNPAAFGIYSPMIAVVFDDRALALDLLERGYARATEANTGFVGYMILGFELFAPLRNEPRFQAILSNLGIDLE